MSKTTETVKVDLTVPLLVWAIIWCGAAVGFGNYSLLWVAMMPLIIWLFIVTVVVFVALVALSVIHLKGGRIKITHRDGSVTYKQRGVR